MKIVNENLLVNRKPKENLKGVLNKSNIVCSALISVPWIFLLVMTTALSIVHAPHLCSHRFLSLHLPIPSR